MNPLIFLQKQKSDLLYSITKDGLYSSSFAEQLISKVIEIINLLGPVRHSELQTKAILRSIEELSDLDGRTIKYLLLEAVKYDDSYLYSYRLLAVEANRDIGLLTYPIKNIDYDKLIQLIEAKDTPPKLQLVSTTNYSLLLDDLKQYISGISYYELQNIIEHKCFTYGTPKAKWIGKKVDAFYFAEYINMTLENWNNYFEFPDGKKLHSKYKDKNDMVSPIVQILNSHFRK